MSSANRRILFVTYGGGHAPMAVPVVRSLLGGRFDVRVLALTMAQAIFEREGIPHLGFRDFLLDSDREALRIGRDLAATMHADHTGIPREESVAYLGLSYVDLAARVGEAQAAEQFGRIGRKSFLPLGPMERIFDRIRPEVVVTTNSPRAELAARQVAAQRGIPVVVLTDLLGTHIHPLTATHLCVACKHALRRYQESPTVKAGSFHIVGNPAMDAALAHRGPRDPETQRRLFPSRLRDPFYVLAAEQAVYQRRSDGAFVPWTPDQVRNNLERLYDACRDLNAVLLIRPHPSLSPAPYSEWARSKEAGTVHLADAQPLYPLLRACDVVISNLSTIMLDALYMDRPVLLVRYPGSGTLLPFDEMGFAFSAPMEDATGLRESLRASLRDAERIASHAAAFRDEFPDLPCAPRIARIIESCL